MKKQFAIRLEENMIKDLKKYAIDHDTTAQAIIEEYVNLLLGLRKMRTVEMQYEYNGESFEIWHTTADTLEEAWKEMDDRPEEGGWIRFKGSEGIMVVNGGF